MSLSSVGDDLNVDLVRSDTGRHGNKESSILEDERRYLFATLEDRVRLFSEAQTIDGKRVDSLCAGVGVVSSNCTRRCQATIEGKLGESVLVFSRFIVKAETVIGVELTLRLVAAV